MHLTRIVALLSGLTLLTAPSVGATTDYDATPIVLNVIENVVRPGFSDFSEQTNTISQSVEQLCTSPGEGSLSTARSDFGDLVESWGRVEMIRFGPLAADNRLERILFWPDRRGRGLKQVREVIRTKDQTAQNVESLSKKSVAVQGLMGLEYALFGADADVLLSHSGRERCLYARTITLNLVAIANDVDVQWGSDEPGGITDLWLNPSETNPLFRDAREQMAALFKIVGEGLEIIKVQRLDPFLRGEFESAKPKSALFWRSKNTIRSMRANVEGLQAVMTAGQFHALLSDDDRRSFDSLVFEFNNTVSALSSVDISTQEIAQSETDYDKLAYVGILLTSLEATLSGQLSAAFNLSSGFSSLDGD